MSNEETLTGHDLITALETISAGPVVAIVVAHVLARRDRKRKYVSAVGKIDTNGDTLEKVREIVNGRYTELARRNRILEEYLGLMPGQLPTDLAATEDGELDATR